MVWCSLDQRAVKRLAQLQMESHYLAIETGPWVRPHRISRVQRGCPLCRNGDVEDEMHFVFECQRLWLGGDTATTYLLDGLIPCATIHWGEAFVVQPNPHPDTALWSWECCAVWVSHACGHVDHPALRILAPALVVHNVSAHRRRADRFRAQGLLRAAEGRHWAVQSLLGAAGRLLKAADLSGRPATPMSNASPQQKPA